MVCIAIDSPKTHFLAYTKRFDYIPEHLPGNLTIIASMWPGLKIPKGNHPKAWISTDERKPRKAWICNDNCPECRVCWYLKPGESVVFPIH
jgi:hypothetical protein